MTCNSFPEIQMTLSLQNRLHKNFGNLEFPKPVIDIKKKICSAGCDRHFESEKILLDDGSKQSNIWGGGIDLDTKTIDFNSFINIRPMDKNTSNEIQDPKIREELEKLMKYFFGQIYE